MNGKYNGYIWPCVAVWAFDRVARVFRLVYFNLPLRSAILSYNSEADMVRLDFPKPKQFRPRPGTYYYIYVLQGLKFWESHPFTLSSWTKEHVNGTGLYERYGKSEINESLSFIIRPHDSFTRRLRESLLLQQMTDRSGSDSCASLRVLVEGPYGHHVDLNHYGSLLFVIGGTGITVALAHLCDLYYSGGNNRPGVRLVWVIREMALFQDVHERELEQWLTSTKLRDRVRLEIEVYVTAGPALPGSTKNSAEASGLSSPIEKEINMLKDHELPAGALKDDSRVEVFDRRPNVLQVVTAAVEKHALDGGIGRLAVVSCGPPPMADDARAAVVKMLGEGHAELDYFPESFTW